MAQLATSLVMAGAMSLHAGTALVQGAEKHLLQSMGPRPLTSATAISRLPELSPIRKMATPVGAIYLQLATTDGPSQQCVGTLISPQLVLTGRHCLDVEDPLTGEVERVKPKAIFILLDKLEPNSGTRVDLEPEPVDFGKNKDLDFAVLRAKAIAVGPERRIPPVGADPALPSDLYIIHQPFSGALHVTGRECQTTANKLPGVNFEHLCDTHPGSSGAPIFDSSMSLVGIHVAGGKGDGKANYGLLLSSILAQSAVVRDALHKYSSHEMLFSPPAPESSAIKLALSDGTVLAELNGEWSLLSSGENRANSQPLKVQAGSTEEYVLWDPSTDSIYRVPKGAGIVKRRKSGETLWTEIGKGG
jgi:hypothetical protein